MFLIRHKCLLPTDSPPVVSVVGVVSETNDTSTTTLTIQWNITNGVGGVLTIAVAPVAPYTPLASGAGDTYATTIILLYNTNYSVEATATSCGGTHFSQISLLQGTDTVIIHGVTSMLFFCGRWVGGWVRACVRAGIHAYSYIVYVHIHILCMYVLVLYGH